VLPASEPAHAAAAAARINVIASISAGDLVRLALAAPTTEPMAIPAITVASVAAKA